jgi:hypothetical protein
MLAPALLYCLATCAAAHSTSLDPPKDLPPWGAALFERFGAMETLISEQSRTIQANTARITHLEARLEARPQANGTSAPVRITAKHSLDHAGAADRSPAVLADGERSTLLNVLTTQHSCACLVGGNGSVVRIHKVNVSTAPAPPPRGKCETQVGRPLRAPGCGCFVR